MANETLTYADFRADSRCNPATPCLPMELSRAQRSIRRLAGMGQFFVSFLIAL
jgi:hypothetical protein